MITNILALLFIFARVLREVNFSPFGVGSTWYGAERRPVFFYGSQKVRVQHNLLVRAADSGKTLQQHTSLKTKPKTKKTKKSTKMYC